MLSVLFVCTGNICRSPLAEGFLNDRSDRWLGGAVRARSAGTWARRGHPVMGESVRVGSELGIEVDGHRASPLTVDAIERADLVLGMTGEHRDEAIRVASHAAGKVFTLKELVTVLRGLEGDPAGTDPAAVRDRIARAHALRSGEAAPVVSDEDVMDPLGMGLEVYRGVASEIEQWVDALVRHLFGVSEPAGAERS